MKTEAITPVLTRSRSKHVDSLYQRTHRKWVLYMLTTTISAGITGIFGLVLAGAALLNVIGARSSWGFTGTILLAVTFPLLVLAAHCLDMIEEVNRAHRVASYKRMVFGADHAVLEEDLEI